MVIPAFNEERYIGRTLAHLRAAVDLLRSTSDSAVEIIVADNASTDSTAALARKLDVRVVGEAEHNIGRVRNTGARAAVHDVLVFLDADTLVPRRLLVRIADVMRNPVCAGGAVDVRLRPRRFLVRAYIELMRSIAALARMHMGACQFARRSVFNSIGGYDETQFIGEDVDFVWRLSASARRRGLTTVCLRDIYVITSSRRFDRWPFWRTLLMTHPLVVLSLRRHRRVWQGWYDESTLPR